MDDEQRLPVEVELNRLQRTGLSAEPGFVGKSLSVAGQQVRLSREQESAYQQQAGKVAYGLISQVIADPAWKHLPDEDKVKTLRSLYDSARQVGRAQSRILPNVVDQAQKQLEQKARGAS